MLSACNASSSSLPCPSLARRLTCCSCWRDCWREAGSCWREEVSCCSFAGIPSTCVPQALEEAHCGACAARLSSVFGAVPRCCPSRTPSTRSPQALEDWNPHRGACAAHRFDHPARGRGHGRAGGGGRCCNCISIIGGSSSRRRSRRRSIIGGISDLPQAAEGGARAGGGGRCCKSSSIIGGSSS